MSDCYVYARCNSGRRRYLEVLFTGTRKECNEHVAQRARNGQPTQFIEVSSLGMLEATRKFCDGARFDPVTCCYYD